MADMAKLNYPEARRDETAVNVYHGVEIKDPYVWLEDPDSEETKKYIEAQNAISLQFINAYPKRQAIHDQFTKLWNYPKYTCPSKIGDKFYFYMNTGLQNQYVFYVQDSLDGEPRVFFDPNTLSDDGSVQLTNGVFNNDGSIFAYELSVKGTDWKTINFMNVKTGIKYPNILEKVKSTTITWTHDNKGIFYSCYPDYTGKADGSDTEETKNEKILYHRVESPQSEDVLVVEFPDHPLWALSTEITNCGKWLIVFARPGTQNILVFLHKFSADKEIDSKLELTEMIGTLDAEYKYITNFGTKVIFKTNKNAPNYKIISTDLENFEKDKWSELIAEHPRNILHWASAVHRDKLVVCYMEDVKSVLKVYSLETGQLLKHIPTDVGTVDGITGSHRSSEIYFSFTSFLTPGIIYTADLINDDPPKVYREIKMSGFDASLYETTQTFYSSKDGTKIPMFIVAKKDFVQDGSSPCLLYGYGGFNISIQPYYSLSRVIFLQNLKGIVAVPNIRGGGEYGEKWHEAGRLAKKQNVFDDFQYAAEYLIKNRYTSSKKLIIEGGSNGGLLVAACINQRPDLFGAAVATVGVMDMLKFHKFTNAYFWTEEYGSSDNPEQFGTLLQYSPLHNVKAPKNEGQYPATLLVTADHDDRVVPLHSLKLIATLQHDIGQLPQQTNPLLINIQSNVGHGTGGGTTKEIDQITNIMSFYGKALNLEFE